MPATGPFFSGARPLAFAHRGGSALWPENTLEAFRGAIELGCTHLETDVHLSRDGELVVMHDARLERTTNGSGLVRDHTYAELARLDAGHHFSPEGRSHPWRGRAVRIPRLREVFELSPSVRVNVEMKHVDGGMPRALFDFIEAHALHDRILVASAGCALGREFRALARGRVATSASAREVLAFWLAARARLARLLPLEYDALQVPPRHSGLTVITEAFVRAAHARKLHVHVWTIDEPAEMRRLVSLGVDAIMTDRPDVLLDVLGRAHRA